MTRLKANLIILDRIKHYCLQNPDVRFTQALFNLGINEFKDSKNNWEEKSLKDKYNEESEETLKKLK